MDSVTEPVSMPQTSRYAGQAIDASSRRSIEIMDESLDTLEDKRELCVRYFYHHGRFWNARIPLGQVEWISGQVFNFSKPKTRKGPDGPELIRDARGVPKRTLPILNHVQVRFQLAGDGQVELYPLDDLEMRRAEAHVNDFVYSLEAVGPTGVYFNLRDGVSGDLVSAHRFLSTKEMVFERIVVENQYVTESAHIPLDESQRRLALCRALRRSHQAGMSERYFLYRLCATNNCTSSPFQILDEIVDYTFWQRVGSWLYRLPLSPRLYLRLRGLDVDPKVRNLLRDEFADYIADPDTRQRKREYVKRVAEARRNAEGP